ncbi:DoxX family protein [Akkermansiaceae bacterium]|nr:DoxX family protein [Akkermansiaceae bacterium]MDA7887968.1 DoxX family protein [Akkermansiaceae bacterium]
MNPILSWALRLVPAIILAQTLPFKFSGAPESKEIFTKLTEKAFGNDSLEELMRIGTGALELVCVVLLLMPKFCKQGAVLTIFAMGGALMSHTIFIGFKGSHGTLAFLAFLALISCFVFLVKSYLSEDPRKPK